MRGGLPAMLLGEVVGTFLLVLFGTGAVASAQGVVPIPEPSARLSEI